MHRVDCVETAATLENAKYWKDIDTAEKKSFCCFLLGVSVSDVNVHYLIKQLESQFEKLLRNGFERVLNEVGEGPTERNL
jgi:hypothetical protein